MPPVVITLTFSIFEFFLAYLEFISVHHHLNKSSASNCLTNDQSVRKYCDSVFVTLSRVEKVTVPEVEGETVVAEGVDDFAGVRVDLLDHALAAERSFRQDRAFRTESYPTALPARVFDQVVKAVQSTEKVDRSATNAFLLVSDVEAEVSLPIYALGISIRKRLHRAQSERNLTMSWSVRGIPSR